MIKALLFFHLVLFSVGAVWAQKTITGTITDTDNIPLIGVNLFVKGSSSGAITNIEGQYSLDVPLQGGILVASYIGYNTQEKEIGETTILDFILTEGLILQEIVVTALGIERESRSLGYSVDQIESEELIKARSTNIVNSLQGKVTGVNISNTSGNLGGSSKIIIRGATSLSGRNNPLWIIDGMPFNDNQFVTGSRISGNRDFGNGASVINPDDVESMSVLKGAAATALYGSRAAAGAIIVTTKQGKSNAKGNAKITVNSSYRIDELFIIPDYQQQYAMGSQTKYDSSSVGFDWGPPIVGQTVSGLPITGESGPLQGIEDNGIKDFFSRGYTAINNFAISDGNQKMDYRLSFAALNQTGIVPGSQLDRYNISINAGVKHSSKLKSRFGVQFIKTDSKGTAAAGANDPNIISLASFSSTLDQRLFKPWIDENGNQLNQLTPTSNNPFWIRNENRNDRSDTRLLANASLSFSPIENLNFTGKIGYDYGQDNRFLSNRKGTAQRLNGNFNVDNINAVQFNSDLLGTYTRDLNDDFTLSVLAGVNYNKRTTTTEGLISTDLLIAELFSPGNTEQNTPVRGFQEQVLYGLYGSADINYRNYLTLTLTGRNDWSSTLPRDNRSYLYPSASIAFIFSDAIEAFQGSILNFGKLRASFAQVGNDTGPYQLDFNFLPINTAFGQYGLNINFPFDGRLAFSKSNIIPPTNLRPEQQNSWEIGTELDFFDSRIGLDVAYFKTENKDQILALPIPQSTGFARLRTNVGQVNTSGVEITLDAVPLKFKDFIWTTSVNYSSSDVNVVELAGGVERVLIASAFNSVQVVAEKGKGFELLAIPFLRDSLSGRPLINPADGTRQAGEAKTMGSVLPDFTMGFINSFDVGNFNLSFTIDWKSGGVMKSSSVESLQGGGLVTETLRNRGGTFIDVEGVIANEDGSVRDNDIPVWNAEAWWTSIQNNSIGEAYIFDASFVKLREVAINYTFPKAQLGNGIFESITLGLEARNLALLYSKVPHVDPENTLFGSGADGFGIERASVPTSRSIGFNIRAQF